MNTKNMANSNRKLLSYFTSTNPKMVGFKLIPFILFLGYFISQQKVIKITVYGLSFIIGILTWSLFEYVTHRWVYHIQYKNKQLKWLIDSFHLHHHHHLQDYEVLNAGFFITIPVFFTFWISGWLLTANTGIASMFCFGILVYYFFYENVHYYIHYKEFKTGYMKHIQQYHLYHHYNKWNKNYGNTTTIWDRLFGTYDKAYKSIIYSAVQKNNFITKY